MLNWVIAFLVIALIAAVLGFGGIAGTAVGIAKILFVVFLVLFAISAVARRFDALISLAEEQNDPATADLATARVAFHEKAAWMLRAAAAS